MLTFTQIRAFNIELELQRLTDAEWSMRAAQRPWLSEKEARQVEAHLQASRVRLMRKGARGDQPRRHRPQPVSGVTVGQLAAAFGGLGRAQDPDYHRKRQERERAAAERSGRPPTG